MPEVEVLRAGMGRNEPLWVKVKKSNNQRTIGLQHIVGYSRAVRIGNIVTVETQPPKKLAGLNRLARGAHEIAQYRNVWAVGADAAGIYG